MLASDIYRLIGSKERYREGETLHELTPSYSRYDSIHKFTISSCAVNSDKELKHMNGLQYRGASLLIQVAPKVFHMRQGWGPMILRIANDGDKVGLRKNLCMLFELKLFIWFPVICWLFCRQDEQNFATHCLVRCFLLCFVVLGCYSSGFFL